ncbi:MAG: class I SAM-dependent methyltransferase [Parachlamydiales bacterium]|nr:class I SAM-dependent methyltransferase [Parachlamydiales bacterium]
MNDLFHPIMGKALKQSECSENFFLIDTLILDLIAYKNAIFTQDWFPYRGAWVHFLAHEQVKNYLEIGCYEGRSTLLAASLFRDAKLTIIDLFVDPEAEVRFLANTKHIQDRISLLRGTSQKRLAEISDKTEFFDLIYIDGNHFYRHAMMDILGSWPLLKTGGVLIIDDYNWDCDEFEDLKPKKATDQFLTAYSGAYEILFVTNQIALRKLKPEAAMFKVGLL